MPNIKGDESSQLVRTSILLCMPILSDTSLYARKVSSLSVLLLNAVSILRVLRCFIITRIANATATASHIPMTSPDNVIPTGFFAGTVVMISSGTDTSIILGILKNHCKGKIKVSIDVTSIA